MQFHDPAKKIKAASVQCCPLILCEVLTQSVFGFSLTTLSSTSLMSVR